MRVAIEQVLGHSADRVFAVMSDPRNRPLWQQNTSDVEVLTPGPTAVGTRWRETSKGVGTVHAEVVGLAPDVLWEEAGSANAGEMRVAVRLDPEGEATTRISVDVEIHLHGARRMFGSALGPMVSRQMARDLVQLEALLDRGDQKLHQPE